MLEGRRFTLYTDHKPLTFALSKVAEPWTARQSRHLSYIAGRTAVASATLWSDGKDTLAIALTGARLTLARIRLTRT